MGELHLSLYYDTSRVSSHRLCSGCGALCDRKGYETYIAAALQSDVYSEMSPKLSTDGRSVHVNRVSLANTLRNET
jgi:hypothetical protein